MFLPKLCVICTMLSNIIVSSKSARILTIFPVPSISHQLVFRALTQELAMRGHELVIVTPDPEYPKGQAPENIKEIDVHGVSYDIWSRLFSLTSSGNKNSHVKQIEAFQSIMFEVVKADFYNEEFKKIVFGEDKFDLIFLEACCTSTLSLSYIFKAPIIQVSSMTHYFGKRKFIGSPVHFLYPTIERQRLYNLTLLEEIRELYKTNNLMALYDSLDNEHLMALEEYFGYNLTSYDDMKNSVEMVFLNSHPIWDDNRPEPPGVVYLGGLPQKPIKEIPKDLKTYLDSSKHGVIYISFGTNMKPSMMPQQNIKLLLNVFSKLPYDVIWKWDTDELIGRPQNVKIAKWVPQSDLLRHPKIKLFITQGGLQSIDEAIIAGVPMIGIPFFGDQWFNTEKIVHHNIGLQLDMPTLTETQLMDAIKTIVLNNRYRENVSRLRSLLYDRPQKALERAIWWTEYVLRHGTAKQLRAPATNMPWTHYIELELIIISLASLLAVVLLISLAVYSFWMYVIRNVIAVIKFKRTLVSICIK